ncbi:MAG: hypothetical protein AAF549_09065 [Pseudomonadota bacterium]
MIKILPALLFLIFLNSPVSASTYYTNNNLFKSVSFEGAPIATKHFQSDDEDFRERHFLGVVKAHTHKYGNWGLYFLGPNSVDDTSVGFGYVTNPWVYELGPTQLEFSGALGLVTGYQDYPVPLLAGQITWQLYSYNQWDFGLSMAALPYYVEEENSNDSDFGIVVTSPFLSVRYNF